MLRINFRNYPEVALWVSIICINLLLYNTNKVKPVLLRFNITIRYVHNEFHELSRRFARSFSLDQMPTYPLST